MKQSQATLAFIFMSILCHAAFAEEKQATRVTTVAFEDALVTLQQSAPASVVSLNHATLSAQLAAQIEVIHARVGNEVRKGETLVTLDCREARERRNIAKASLTLAEKAARRARSLSTSKNIAEQNLNEADASLNRARAEYRLAVLQVEHCEVKAPYDGIVTAKHVAEGELASVGTPLLELVDHQNTEISAHLAPAQASRVSSATELLFASGNQHSPVSIRAVSGVIHPEQHTVEVRLLFSETPHAVGSQGRLQWALPGRYLNTAYVLERNGALGYFVVDQQTAKFVALPEAVLGTPPLIADQQGPIIHDGRHSLVDGTPVTLTKAVQ